MIYNRLTGSQKRQVILTFCVYALVGITVLCFFAGTLYQERIHARDGWDARLSDSPEVAEIAAELSQTATPVTVGTYMENLRELNIKSSYYRVEFLVWFDWEGDEALDVAHNFRVYKGAVNKMELVNELHENGQHYQLVRVDVSVSTRFDTRRFPLESHQLRFYVESTAPIEEVVFVPDTENSGLNRDLQLTGYTFERHGIGDRTYIYDSTHGDPTLNGREVTSEIVTAFEINRANMGMYFKCFIALAGTITWVLISLFLNTYHHVDPLGMIPGALFGTVSNIMIGASLLPDALEMGLLEYVNLWGVMTILAVTLAIISINRVRKKSQEDKDFAHFFGRVLFYTVLFFAVVGQVVLPLAAYAR